MKKCLVLFLLLLAYIVPVDAQVNFDSLRTLLPNARDTNRVDILNQLARWSLPNKDKSAEYAAQALEAGNALNYQRGLAYTYFCYGLIYLEYAKYDSAVYYTKQALSIAKANNLDQYIGFCYNSLGEIHHNQGNFLKAIEFYLESEKIKTKINDIKGLVATAYNIGTLNLKIKNYKEAEFYINKCYELSKSRPSKFSDITYRYSIGQVRLAQKRYKEAITYVEKAISRSKEEKLSGDFTSKMSSTLGKAYAGDGQLDKALPILLGSVAYFKQKGFSQEETEDLLVIADIYQQQGKLTDAVKIAGDAVNTSKSIKDVDLAHAASDKYAALLGAMGDYKQAFENQVVTNALQDSVFDVEKSKEFNRLQTAYEVEKKENAIKLLTQQNQLQQVEKERQQLLKNITIAGLIITIGFIFLVYQRYREKQQSNLQLQQQQTIIYYANAQLQQLIGEKDKLLGEKDLLLKEIHHRVKNNLQLMNSLLSLQMKSTQNDQVTQAIEESQSRLQSIALIHEKLYQNEDISSLHFPDYVQSLIQSLFQVLRAPTQNVSYRLDADPIMLDVETTLRLGLVINELIINAFKHAFPNNRTGEIVVSLHQTEAEQYQLQVSDNGIGLQPATDIPPPKSLGLQLVNIIARQLDGILTIKNGVGTTILLDFAKKNLVKSN